VDGLLGTSDDQSITLFGLPTAQQSRFPVDQIVMNVDQFSRYKTVEASVSKRHGNRWSAFFGGSYSWRHDFPENFPNVPGAPGVEDRTTWDFKATASYDAPYDIRISPVLRHQSGVNFARTISVPGNAATPFGLIYPATTIYADAANNNREDNISVFDVRVEKVIGLGSRTKLRTFFDLFNIANSHASEGISRVTGTSYLKPSTILAPRTARVGFRFVW
jgi:hypothetical protein